MALDSDERTLYVGNLDKNVSEDVLFELFLQAGPIDELNIVSNKINSCHYGFVTYKHKVSIDYAIELFKGTLLFNKELSIKKKGTNNNSSQSYDNGEHSFVNSVETYSKPSLELGQFAQDQLYSGVHNFRLNDNFGPQMIFNLNPMNENRSFRSKPYDYKQRNNFWGPQNERNRYNGRNVSHHSRIRY